jgi:hypothetical protein
MLLTVKNRCQESVVGMYNGVVYEVKTTMTVPAHIARHLKHQSVYSDNPVTGERKFRLAIVEDGDDDSPLGELPLDSLDRTDMEMPNVEYKGSGVKTGMPAQRGSGRFDSITVTDSR